MTNVSNLSLVPLGVSSSWILWSAYQCRFSSEGNGTRHLTLRSNKSTKRVASWSPAISQKVFGPPVHSESAFAINSHIIMLLSQESATGEKLFTYRSSNVSLTDDTNPFEALITEYKNDLQLVMQQCSSIAYSLFANIHAIRFNHATPVIA